MQSNNYFMSSDSASKKIGENLLKGWTLLGDVCPEGCNIPLMRSRDQKHLVCCGCEKDFLAVKETVMKSCKNQDLLMDNRTDNSPENNSKGSFPKLISALDSKICHIATMIENTSSLSEIGEMVDVASRLVRLRREL